MIAPTVLARSARSNVWSSTGERVPGRGPTQHRQAAGRRLLVRRPGAARGHPRAPPGGGAALEAPGPAGGAPAPGEPWDARPADADAVARAQRRLVDALAVDEGAIAR